MEFVHSQFDDSYIFPFVFQRGVIVKEGSHKLCTCITITEQHSLCFCLQVFYFNLPDIFQFNQILKMHVVLA